MEPKIHPSTFAETEDDSPRDLKIVEGRAAGRDAAGDAGNIAERSLVVPDLIAHVSQVMTLLPGDVLLTGTPAGVGPLTDGDEVSVTIESIGTLTNRVVIGD